MAQRDPTTPEVLIREQVKVLIKNDLMQVIKEFLTDHIGGRYNDDKQTLRDDAEAIFSADLENTWPDIPLDDGQKNVLKTRIDDEIKKADKEFKEALACSPIEEHQYRVVTMNMAGTNAAGVTDHRRAMICIILHRFVPDVVFCQELPGHFERDVVQQLNTDTRVWNFTRTENEAGVLWDSNRLEGSTDNFQTTDRRMISIRDNLIEQGKPVENLLSRASFVKLTETSEETISPRSFIAVSYHGQHNAVSLRERIQKFEGLIEFTRQLCEQEANIPFLIGGDFNFNTTDIDLPQGITVPSYEMTPRSASERSERNEPRLEASARQANQGRRIPYKDNFVWKSDDFITVRNVRPFCFQRGVNSDLTIDERNYIEQMPERAAPGVVADDILDHDPIIGVLELENQEVPRGNEEPADTTAAQLSGLDLNADAIESS